MEVVASKFSRSPVHLILHLTCAISKATMVSHLKLRAHRFLPRQFSVTLTITNKHQTIWQASSLGRPLCPQRASTGSSVLRFSTSQKLAFDKGSRCVGRHSGHTPVDILLKRPSTPVPPRLATSTQTLGVPNSMNAVLFGLWGPAVTVRWLYGTE